MSETIEMEFTFDAPPEKVWRAVSVTQYRERWLPGADLAQDEPVSVEEGSAVSGQARGRRLDRALIILQRRQQRLVAALRFRQHALCIGLDVVSLRARRGKLRGLDLVKVRIGRSEHVIGPALARDRRDADVSAGHCSRSGGRNGLR